MENENWILGRGTPPKYNILQYFEYSHLPEFLQVVSQPFHKLAHEMVNLLPDGHDETYFMLRKLLESKDSAVRAKVSEKNNG